MAPSQAVEVAIALAASDSRSKHIITDSRYACLNYTVGWIKPLAERILRAYIRDTDPLPKHIFWTPGHHGLGANEAVNASARALTFQGRGRGGTAQAIRKPFYRKQNYCLSIFLPLKNLQVQFQELQAFELHLKPSTVISLCLVPLHCFINGVLLTRTCLCQVLL